MSLPSDGSPTARPKRSQSPTPATSKNSEIWPPFFRAWTPIRILPPPPPLPTHPQEHRRPERRNLAFTARGPLLTTFPDPGSASPAQNWLFLERLLFDRCLRPHFLSSILHGIPRLAMSHVLSKERSPSLSLNSASSTEPLRLTEAWRRSSVVSVEHPRSLLFGKIYTLLLKSHARDFVSSHVHIMSQVTLEETHHKYFCSQNNPIFLMSAVSPLRKKNTFVMKIGCLQVWIAITVEKTWTPL